MLLVVFKLLIKHPRLLFAYSCMYEHVVTVVIRDSYEYTQTQRIN